MEDSFDDADNTAPKQRGRRSSPEKAATLMGGRRVRETKPPVLAQSLLDGEVEAIICKVIEKAKDGDMTTLRICLDRLLAPRRERRVAFELPVKIETAADAAKASSAVLAECAAGNLSPSEASEFLALISSHVRVLEVAELEARVATLENRVKP